MKANLKDCVVHLLSYRNIKEALINTSFRRRPESRALKTLDPGIRRDDGKGINQRGLNALRITLLAVGILLPATLLHAQLPVPELNHQLTKLVTPVAAPDFTLADMDDKSYSLSSYRGKVLMVNFWATWCPPCRRELPSMEALYQAFKDDGFTILAINQWESPDHVFAYMGQLDVIPNFPILFDRESTVSVAYGVKGLPTTVLIDKRGRVVYRAVGGRDFNHAEVRAIIRGLLAEGGKR